MPVVEVEASKKNLSKKSLNLYEPLDFFMLRTPIMSVEFFLELFDPRKIPSQDEIDQVKETILALSKKDLFRDIISTTSPSLQNALDRLESDRDPGKKKIITQSFTKYLIRMSTRPTPFGLLSGVSAGKLDNYTGIKIKPHPFHTKRARPDMEWLMGVINNLEKRRDVVGQLKVRANTSVLLSGARLEIPYITRYGQKGQEDKSESISIRATKVVKYALEQAGKFILYSELLSRLKLQYPETAESKVEEFLWQLFQNEYLISELRPPLMNPSPFDYVIGKLSGIEGIAKEFSEITEIRDLIQEYNHTKPGEGGAIFTDLSNKMDRIYQVKHSTQVDLATSVSETVLNRSLANELAQAAECLWRLSPESPSSPDLKRYRMEFIEKYGVYREIPVLELLDNDRGLGAPPNYFLPKGKMETVENPMPLSVRKLEGFLLNELTRAVKDKQMEIEITPELLEKLEPVKPAPELAPLTLELYFSIAASSEAAVDNGDYEIILGPNMGSPGAGKTFGRFLDLLSPELRRHLHRVNEIEQGKLKECILAELVYMPDKGRNANVTISENIRDYEIVIGTNSSKPEEKTLPLSDILVGATENYLYLKSRSLNQRLIITTGHMLNTQGTPNVYKFLREVSLDGTRDLAALTFGNFSNAPFIPQIRFGKVILSPAKWGLSLNILQAPKDQIRQDFTAIIKKWREEWNVPRLVYLTDYDNRILLDLEHPLHLEVLQDEMLHKEDNSIFEIVGMGEDFSKIWVAGESGRYVSEFVLPFTRREEAISSSQTDRHSKEKPERESIIQTPVLRGVIPNTLRSKYPGSEWLYLKLYGNRNREDEFLAFELNNFCQKLIGDQFVGSFFFVRYQDQEPHLRLRFKGDPGKITARLIPCLNEWFSYLAEAGLLSKVSMDTYEREIERYGGPDLIDSAEELFYHDSVAALKLLFMKRAGVLKISYDILVVVSILDLLENLGLSFEEQLDWLNSMVTPKDFADDFRESRRLLMELGEPANNWEALRNHENGEEIYQILSARKPAVSDFAAKLQEVAAKNELWNHKVDIIASIIHLHCNRLLGVNRDHEKKVMAFVRHTQSSLKLYKKERNNLG